MIHEAERLVEAGVQELLVISQDTSVYGADVEHASTSHRGKQVRAHITDLAEALGGLGVWVRLHHVYPHPHIDSLIPLMAEEKILPYIDVPFQHASPSVLKAMRRPAASGKRPAPYRRLAAAGARSDHPRHFHGRISGRDRRRLRISAGMVAGSTTGPRQLFPGSSRSRVPQRTTCPTMCRKK